MVKHTRPCGFNPPSPDPFMPQVRAQPGQPTLSQKTKQATDKTTRDTMDHLPDHLIFHKYLNLPNSFYKSMALNLTESSGKTGYPGGRIAIFRANVSSGRFSWLHGPHRRTSGLHRWSGWNSQRASPILQHRVKGSQHPSRASRPATGSAGSANLDEAFGRSRAC